MFAGRLQLWQRVEVEVLGRGNFQSLPPWMGLLSSVQEPFQVLLFNPRLSPFPLFDGVVTVPAFARKFLVTDTALKVMGFLIEFERA